MRTIFITGASSGIGAALAVHYSRTCGAHVGLLGRRADALVRVHAQCMAVNTETKIAPQVSTACADVRDPIAMQSALAQLINVCGLPDIVIANAGVSMGMLAGDARDISAFETVLQTNVLGLVHTFTPVIDAMVKRGSGTLVGIASVAGLRGAPGAAAYAASKAAAISYCESLRVELRGTGVKVVTICPGFIDTPMTRVNRFAMPFLLPADQAAQRIARVIDAQRAFAIVPWPMAVIGRVLRCMPIGIFDRIAARMPRKSRSTSAP